MTDTNTDKLHQDIAYYEKHITAHALSVPFVLGCLLLTVGTIGVNLIHISWLTAVNLTLVMIHIIALWLIIFEAHSTKKVYSKTLVALKMFKISAILNLVSFVVSFGLFGFDVLFYLSNILQVILILGAIGGMAYVLVKYYFIAMFKVLDCIRFRMLTNSYAPMEELGSFLAISYIGLGLTVVSALFSAESIVSPNAIFTMISSIGTLLCLYVLRHIE